jgi:hypothetical protein
MTYRKKMTQNLDPGPKKTNEGGKTRNEDRKPYSTANETALQVQKA